MIAGLSAMAVPSLASCAGQQRTPSPRLLATTQPITAPSDVGLDAVIDISHTSTVTDFTAMRSQGNIMGVLHKATEGGDWYDPLYAQRRVQAQAAGLLWGAYHFGTHQYSGAQQAAAFLAATQSDPMTMLALDLEPNDRKPGNTMTLDQAEDFVQTVYQATGRLPLVYTHPTWANGGVYGRARISLGRPITTNSILASCDLWLVDYRVQPEMPMAWANRGWRLWQYAGDDYAGGGGPFGPLSRAVAGVDRCDRNLFQGDMMALYQFWNGATGPAA